MVRVRSTRQLVPPTRGTRRTEHTQRHRPTAAGLTEQPRGSVATRANSSSRLPVRLLDRTSPSIKQSQSSFLKTLQCIDGEATVIHCCELLKSTHRCTGLTFLVRIKIMPYLTIAMRRSSFVSS
jgi:hypothetical protein